MDIHHINGKAQNLRQKQRRLEKDHIQKKNEKIPPHYKVSINEHLFYISLYNYYYFANKQIDSNFYIFYSNSI